jgi:hypothetical protein
MYFNGLGKRCVWMAHGGFVPKRQDHIWDNRNEGQGPSELSSFMALLNRGKNTLTSRGRFERKLDPLGNSELANVSRCV